MKAQRKMAACITLSIGLLATKAQALSLCMPEGEIARVPFSNEKAFRAEFNNDSYSLFPGDDWDDFRTFGVYVGIADNDWTFELTADSLTARTATAATGGRIDEIYGILSRRIFSVSRFPLPRTELLAEARLGGGVLSTGDFGTYALQETVHELYGCGRQTPDTANTPERKGMLAANAVLLLGLDNPAMPLFAATAIEGASSGLWRVSLFSGVDYRSALIKVKAYGGLVRAAGYSGEDGVAFSETLDSENGWYLGTTVRAGALETGFSWNMTENRQAGYAALVYTGAENPAEPRARMDHVRSVDFRILPLYAGVRIRRSIVEFPVTASFVLGAEGGPLDTINVRDEETLHDRYQQAYLAIEASRTAFRFAEFYAMAGGGWRAETRKTAMLTEARLIDEKSSPVFAGEGGIRIFLPRKNQGETDWGLGVSGVVNYSSAIEIGWHRFLQVYITGSEGRRSTWQD